MNFKVSKKTVAMVTISLSLIAIEATGSTLGTAADTGAGVMGSIAAFIQLAFGLVGLYNMGTGVAGFARNRQSQGADNSDNWKKLGVGAALFALGWIISIILNSFGAVSDGAVTKEILGGGV
jgi:hypothetical protein